MSISIIKTILPLLIAFGTGKLFAKTGIINDDGCATLKAVLSKIMIPVILLDSMLFSEYSSKTLILIIVAIFSHSLIFGLACLLKRFLPSREKYFPFFVSSWEGGSLGIPLCLMLLGQQSSGLMAILDFGQTILLFILIVPVLQVTENEKPNFKKLLKIIITSPCFDAIVIGAILGVIGLGNIIKSSSVLEIWQTTVSSVTGSTGFLVMLTIGYGFKLKKSLLKDIAVSSLFRIFVFAIGGAFTILVMKLFSSMDEILFKTILIAYSLPTSFGLFSMGKFTKNEDYMSAGISFYTIITIISFLIISSL